MSKSGAALMTVLTCAAVCVGCLSVDAISPERANAERAAIQRDIQRDFGTLCNIASRRAKIQHPELGSRRVACVIADVHTTFTSDVHARQTLSYVCGIAPWRPKHSPPVATPTIPLDLLKERGTWMINGFP